MRDMKRYTRENRTENYSQQKGPDCDTCIHRRVCSHSLSGSFCTGWQGNEPEQKGPGPNEAWLRGDDAPEI